MPDRTRPIRKEICLNEQGLNLIQHKMRQLGTHNFGAYAHKMLIDGYIIKVDYTEQKKLAAAVSQCRLKHQPVSAAASTVPSAAMRTTLPN